MEKDSRPDITGSTTVLPGHLPSREQQGEVAIIGDEYEKIVDLTRDGDTDAAEILMKLEGKAVHQRLIDEMDEDEIYDFK